MERTYMVSTKKSEDIDHYSVETTFCNNQPLSHPHRSVMSAARQYAERLAQAIAPEQLLDPASKHIRFVSFFAYDDNNDVVQEVHTPAFPCEHHA